MFEDRILGIEPMTSLRGGTFGEEICTIEWNAQWTKQLDNLKIEW